MGRLQQLLLRSSRKPDAGMQAEKQRHQEAQRRFTNSDAAVLLSFQRIGVQVRDVGRNLTQTGDEQTTRNTKNLVSAIDPVS
jgi:hypothetical protein